MMIVLSLTSRSVKQYNVFRNTFLKVFRKSSEKFNSNSSYFSLLEFENRLLNNQDVSKITKNLPLNLYRRILLCSHFY